MRGGGPDGYRMLPDGKAGEPDLTGPPEGWLVPDRNPFMVYLYAESVDQMAARFGKKPGNKPWGMYEFAVSDHGKTLARRGRPVGLRGQK